MAVRISVRFKKKANRVNAFFWIRSRVHSFKEKKIRKERKTFLEAINHTRFPFFLASIVRKIRNVRRV